MGLRQAQKLLHYKGSYQQSRDEANRMGKIFSNFVTNGGPSTQDLLKKIAKQSS